MVMTARLVGLVVLALASLTWPASGEEWSRARISRLPDSAFTVVVPPNRRISATAV